MNAIFESREMSALPPEKQAETAILYALRRIKSDPNVAWYMGVGTQTWGLLTEALASLQGEDLPALRESFAPPKAENPERDAQAEAERLDAVIITPEAAFMAEIAEDCSDHGVTPQSVLGYLRRIGSSAVAQMEDASQARRAAQRIFNRLAGVAEQIRGGALT